MTRLTIKKVGKKKEKALGETVKMKVKIEGVKKAHFRSEFTFGKGWEVVDAIDNILEKLGFFDTESLGLKDKIYSGCEHGPLRGIDKFVDEVYDLGNEVYFIDVFLGIKKIILIVRTKEDKQKEISGAVFEFADFEGELK
ncbi:MAG: hypothetical protein U9Q73_01995 [Nanoarchaeota archaeon]|nr:hypothetical protein [Nanoarchaeota archaeon]